MLISADLHGFDGGFKTEIGIGSLVMQVPIGADLCFDGVHTYLPSTLLPVFEHVEY